jgi:heterodisulfide reductase subunit D
MQLSQRQIDYCMECGVCTGSCPVSRELPEFSPRQIIKRAMRGPEGRPRRQDVWACLSCARCSERCPVEIDFPELIRHFRTEARKEGDLPLESHHGIFQTIARLQTRGTSQRRTEWAEQAGSFRDTGDTFYFVGCLPYFDVTFRYLNLSPLDSARGVLKLLNRMGIEPVISNEERCCGHDALWSGDEETFLALAKWNVEVIRASGAKTVLFSCPEGYYTFKNYYTKHLGELPFEVLHMTEFLERELPATGLTFEPSSNGAVTFQDPCRLGRLSGSYEHPRDLLKLAPGTKLTEMKRNRENALCCGTTAWMECSGCSKAMRVERLEEAVQSGANTLVTACPKCQIHFTCALSSAELELGVTDIFSFLSQRLAGDKQ